MSEKGMTVLVKKNLLKGVKGVHIKKYSDCLAGKQHRVAFKSQDPHKKPEVLDLVHFDVCKMSVRSMGGAKYVVTFIDDFPRKVWVYVLKTKDQVLRGCLFGLFFSFPLKKLASPNKRVALKPDFAKAKAAIGRDSEACFEVLPAASRITAETFFTVAHFVLQYLQWIATAVPNHFSPFPSPKISQCFPIERR
jgi:hypothetical protein